MLPKSIPLLTVNQSTHQFIITSEAAQFLSSLQKPIAITTIAGLYRTGKSFLVNRLIRNRQRDQDGFKVGSTTNSVTKGLNIWGAPITITNQMGQQIDYLLIDSEGIGSCEQQSRYDTNLLILVFLISSTVIYNTINAIDQIGLEQLQVVLKLKTCIQNHKLYNPSPKFVWILRDFSLQLIDQHGNEMNPNQYLQKCLEISSSKNIQSRRKNQIRQAIRQNLPNRKCYTLVRPTTKEQDLNNLNSLSKTSMPKIRTEFLGQIEELREDIFTGSVEDIKIINGQKLTGKTLLKVLQEYVNIINEGELPNVCDVWDNIVKSCNQQFFEESLRKLKQEYKSINLPISRDELKIKLNQIGNKIYNEFEKKLKTTTSQLQNQQSVYKHYHKQFIKAIQKQAIQIKNKNQQLRNSSVLAELRQFVKQNVQFQKISPLNVGSLLKNLIERMKIKTNGYGQGYQYLISVINDILFIVQQKANKSERELIQYKLVLQKQQSEKKHQDLVLINIKKQYHQSLKTIAKLQQGQAQVDKNHSLLKNRAYQFQRKCIELEDENKQLIEQNTKIYKQMDEKLMKRSEELGQTIRNLREQNKNYSQQIYQLKSLDEVNKIKERKQIIFQQKIQASYSKFQKQRKQLIEKANNSSQQIRDLKKQYQRLNTLYEQQLLQKQQMKIQMKKKQANYEHQFQNLKKCIRQTQNSYQLTHKTKQQTGKVLKDIQNLTSAKKSKNFCSAGPDTRDDEKDQKQRQIMKKYYENQINKLKQDHNEQIDRLQSRLNALISESEDKNTQHNIFQQQNKDLKRKIIKLQKQITQANKKFTSCLKQIESARENQRKLYEDSIVRLLNNIQKKSTQSDNQKSRISLAYTRK